VALGIQGPKKRERGKRKKRGEKKARGGKKEREKEKKENRYIRNGDREKEEKKLTQESDTMPADARRCPQPAVRSLASSVRSPVRQVLRKCVSMYAVHPPFGRHGTERRAPGTCCALCVRGSSSLTGESCGEGGGTEGGKGCHIARGSSSSQNALSEYSTAQLEPQAWQARAVLPICTDGIRADV